MPTTFETGKKFVNWSQGIELTPQRTYRPTSSDDVVRIVEEANRLARRVRAVGSGWSFGDVMTTPDFLVETSAIRGIVAFSQGRQTWGPTGPLPTGPDLPESSRVLNEVLRDEVLASDRRFVHVRAGTTIRELYEALDRPGRGTPRRERWTLPTMGGASGQTIAGAISTGTHGGHFDLPPIADMVRAIQLVDPSGKVRWIERGGPGAISDRERLKRRLRIDDDKIHLDDKWFNAAVVAVGTFGIITDYVLEVRAQYGLSEVSYDTTWNDIKPLLTSGEIFTSTRFDKDDPGRRWIDDHPAGGREPACVGIFINPYRLSDNYGTADSSPNRRVFLVTHASSNAFNGAHSGPSGASIFDQMHLIADFESSGSLRDTRLVVDRVIDMLRSGEGTGGHYRVSHSVLDTTSSNDRPPVLSLEIAVTTADNRHVRMVDRLLQIFDQRIKSEWDRGNKGKFAGGLNLRFTRPTTAYLGMQSPVSNAADERICHIEVVVMREQWITGRPIGADYTKHDMESITEELTDAFERATDELGARLHWGQLSRTRRHDADKYPHFDSWMQIKNLLTNNGSIRTFENDFSQRHLLPQHDVTLRASNGKYVVAEGGGGRELLANRDRAAQWETFKLIHLGGTRIALRAHNGQYVSAEGGGGGPLVATRPHIRGWETFELVNVSEGRVALRANNGQYVCAEGGGGGPVVANRDRRGDWETFTITGEPHERATIATRLLVDDALRRIVFQPTPP